MTIRPMIFSAPMVRALLDGRKTQTRRVLKPWPGAQADWLTMDVLHLAPSCHLAEVDGRLGVQMQHPLAGRRIDGIDIDPMSPLTWVRLPYAPGDRVWVKEAHAFDGVIVRYYATDDVHELRKKRPSIHMPRWSSRLTLHITDVPVQRLQEISEADAVAEGATSRPGMWPSPDWSMDWSQIGARSRATGKPLTQACIALGAPRWAFASYWNDRHGPDAWDANPWVCALTFIVQRSNIDQVEVAA